jgi:hypothetical protein
MVRVPKDDPVRELCRLCRAGQLFAVEDWCRAGKPIEPSVSHRTHWPMGIAIDKRFHSLVEVFLRNGASPDARTLYEAVHKNRTAIVKLLFDYGADAKSIPFETVIRSGDPAIIQMFVDRDADIFTGYPIAQGLIRCPRCLLRLCKQLLPIHPDLEFQISMALRHFCEQGSIRNVSLMLWLGGNPRTNVPLKSEDRDEQSWQSSLDTALLRGNLEIVKKLGFDNTRDDPHAAFRLACFPCDLDLLKYLIERGADPNDLDEEGCTAFNTVFWKTEMGGLLRGTTPYAFTSTSDELTCLRGLIAMGWEWKPQQEKEINQLRSILYHMSFHDAYNLIKAMKQHSFCSDHLLVTVLDTPRMRKHLSPRLPALARLLPFFEKWNKHSSKAPRQANT